MADSIDDSYAHDLFQYARSGDQEALEPCLASCLAPAYRQTYAWLGAEELLLQARWSGGPWPQPERVLGLEPGADSLGARAPCLDQYRGACRIGPRLARRLQLTRPLGLLSLCEIKPGSQEQTLGQAPAPGLYLRLPYGTTAAAIVVARYPFCLL